MIDCENSNIIMVVAKIKTVPLALGAIYAVTSNENIIMMKKQLIRRVNKSNLISYC